MCPPAVPVTRNVREFSRVDGLALENWYDESDRLAAPE